MQRIIFPTLRTGGVLNVINEKYGLNHKQKTVPIMQLVDVHKPHTERDLVKLLQSHIHPCPVCPCQVQNGGLQQWAEILQKAAYKDGHTNISTQQCKDFVYDLFVRGPLRGRLTEQAALAHLRVAFSDPNVVFTESLPEHDARYAVDIVMMVDGQIAAGVQVKPTSYRRAAPYVHQWNLKRNAAFGVPVFYVHYDTSGQWIDMTELVQALHNILVKKMANYNAVNAVDKEGADNKLNRPSETDKVMANP